jgi:hypothetical protein
MLAMLVVLTGLVMDTGLVIETEVGMVMVIGAGVVIEVDVVIEVGIVIGVVIVIGVAMVIGFIYKRREPDQSEPVWLPVEPILVVLRHLSELLELVALLGLLELFAEPKLHVGQSLIISNATSLVIQATIGPRPRGTLTPDDVQLLMDWLLGRVMFSVTKP